MQKQLNDLSRERDAYTQRLQITQEALRKARQQARASGNLSEILSDQQFASKVDLDSSSPGKGPYWNVWQEADSDTPSFAPLPALVRGGKNYSLFIDLSAIRYAISSYVTSPRIGALLKTALDTKPGAASKIELVLVPDGQFVELQSANEMNQSVSIDLKRWRAAGKSDFPKATDAFKILKVNPEPDFRFAHTVFGLRTKEKLGMGYVGISVWVDERPVDEISVPICVVDSSSPAAISQCGQLKPTEYSFRGVNPFGHGTLPDAAIHLVQLNSSTLAGVLYCKGCPVQNDSKYLTWILRNSPQSLRDGLNNQVVIPFENLALGDDEKANKQLLDGGEALYSLIFQDNSDRVEPSEPEIAFRGFVSRANQSKQNATDDRSSVQSRNGAPSPALTAPSNQGKISPPSLFVRMLPATPDIAYSVPLDLMVVPMPDGRQEFVGFNVKVESPLEIQDYSVQPSCIDSWRLFVPGPDFPKDSPMELAVRPFVEDVAAFRAWSRHAKVDITVDDFGSWISTRALSPVSTAIVTLSHHASGKLCFSDSNCQTESVKEANIWRGFPHPSFAVINACGTSAPGASEFVRHLNARGVQTIIATSTAVEGAMAGQFLHLLIERLQKYNSPGYTVSDAKFDAVQDLRATYGPRALVYTFLGNDSLRACAPPPPAN
jgi:hypothetical protein